MEKDIHGLVEDVRAAYAAKERAGDALTSLDARRDSAWEEYQETIAELNSANARLRAYVIPQQALTDDAV